MSSEEEALLQRIQAIDANLDKAAHRIGELLIENNRLKELVKRGVENGYIGICKIKDCIMSPCVWAREIKQAAGIPL